MNVKPAMRLKFILSLQTTISFCHCQSSICVCSRQVSFTESYCSFLNCRELASKQLPGAFEADVKIIGTVNTCTKERIHNVSTNKLRSSVSASR